MGEGNVNVSTGPVCDYRAVVMALPQNECEDFKYQEGITPQNSLSIPSSDPLKDYDDEESQLVEGEILPTSCGFVRFGGVQRDDSEEFTDGESIEDCTFDFVSEDKKTGEPIYGLRYKIERNYFARFAKNWVLGRLQRDGLSLADITGEINSSSRVSEKPAEDSAAEDTEGEVSEGEEDSIAEDAGGEHGREVTHNESRERKCFEEIFAEMTGRGIPLLHLPLLSPLSEAADEVVRGEGGNGLNSLAEMDTEDEREKRKWHWASYICCCFCPDL
ncbi:unnamed protein product [Sphenostylis stenocarpa]|uniref:Uncharacterized protein n=1 Tax=Sphenostylis stenocarpa TaxID=92480 RepID=A0AA86RNQ7_9FABA|nr:unnamed protein product [Sphenostylis stenocarpa]